jgi:FAD/FMN-containing dehydrogenase
MRPRPFVYQFWSIHERIKRLFDPKGLLNPGKKLARHKMPA